MKKFGSGSTARPFRSPRALRFWGTFLAACLVGSAAWLFVHAPKDLDKLEASGQVVETDEAPRLYPDYAGVVVPPNIAPLNFEIQEDGQEYLTRFSIDEGYSFVAAGQKTDARRKAWGRLLEGAKGKRIKVEVFARADKKSWKAFAPVFIDVAKEPIDRWLHYRLIEPGYEYFSRVVLAQRDLESFDEQVWFNARMVDSRTCVNCHTFQDHKTDNFLVHMRRVHAGTLLCADGELAKLDPKIPSDPLGVAYAAWHPREPLVAFSSNSTFQMFHATSPDRIEVLDAASDLVLFDVEKRASAPICSTDELFETFPAWSPDGTALYYCVAKSPYSAQEEESDLSPTGGTDAFGNPKLAEFDRRKVEALGVYSDFHYSLARRSFDPAGRAFGEPETLVDAEALGKSVAHPRVSPDGKTLVYTLSKYGTFPIWRRDADLWSLDLSTGETRALEELNSGESESWHEWDSSGRWLFFSSRRDDGAYTRVYIVHYSEDGKWSKPFLLPQRDPEQNIELMKSYNLPTPTSEPMKIQPRKIVRAGRRPC